MSYWANTVHVLATLGMLLWIGGSIAGMALSLASVLAKLDFNSSTVESNRIKVLLHIGLVLLSLISFVIAVSTGIWIQDHTHWWGD